MTSTGQPDADEAFWRDYLTRGDSFERRARRVFLRLPREPRCRLCAAPFAGAAASVMRLIGKRPSDANPTMCDSCFTFVAKHHGGAEIECTMCPFRYPWIDDAGGGDVARGVPRPARPVLHDRLDGRVRPGRRGRQVRRERARGAVLPAPQRRASAAEGVEAAEALLRATGHADVSGPWVPLGSGVHTGPVSFGAVGRGAHTSSSPSSEMVST